MPRLPNPYDDPDLYDCIELGGVKSPGQAKLSGHARKINWDVKEGTAQSGGTTTLKSIPPSTFKVAFFLADAADQAAWPAFDALVRSTIDGAKAKALDVYHPDLATNGFKAVVLANFGEVVHDGKGGQTITIEFQEYKPPKPVKLTPLGALKTKPDPDPNAAAQAQIAALTNQFQNTPAG